MAPLIRNKRFLAGGFFVLALVAAVATAFLAGGGTTELLYGLVGGIATGVVVVGAYVIGTRRGQPHSHAVATAAIVFGTLYIAALVASLFINFGA